MNNQFCPGCEEPVKKQEFEDAAERAWHRKCALHALAVSFRTPLDEVEATAAVSFEYDGTGLPAAWAAPHSFHLREIIFADDVEIENVFLGSKLMIYAQFKSIRTGDLPGRKLVIDRDFPQGLHLTVCGVLSSNKIKYRLIGERRSEKSRPRPSSHHTPAVAPLKAEAVAPGEAVKAAFCMPALFRGERVVCDDWQDWEVVDVKLGADPGRFAYPGPSVRLSGKSTSVSTYEAKRGETVTYTVKNRGALTRALDARVYGTLSF